MPRTLRLCGYILAAAIALTVIATAAWMTWTGVPQ